MSCRVTRQERILEVRNRPLVIWLVGQLHSDPPGSGREDPRAALAARGHQILSLPAEGPLASRLASERPDAIHVRSLPVLASLANRPGRRRLPPIVVGCNPADSLARPAARFLRSDAVDRILVPDESTKIHLIRDAGIDPHKIDIVPTPDSARLEGLYREAAEYKAIRRREIVPQSIKLSERDEG